MVYTRLGYRARRGALRRQRFQLFCRAPPAQGRFDTPQPLCYLPAMPATLVSCGFGLDFIVGSGGLRGLQPPAGRPGISGPGGGLQGPGGPLSGLGLAKGENFLGDEVIYVKGSLTNNGEATIRRVELTFLFKDSSTRWS